MSLYAPRAAGKSSMEGAAVSGALSALLPGITGGWRLGCRVVSSLHCFRVLLVSRALPALLHSHRGSHCGVCMTCGFCPTSAIMGPPCSANCLQPRLRLARGRNHLSRALPLPDPLRPRLIHLGRGITGIPPLHWPLPLYRAPDRIRVPPQGGTAVRCGRCRSGAWQLLPLRPAEPGEVPAPIGDHGVGVARWSPGLRREGVTAVLPQVGDSGRDRSGRQRVGGRDFPVHCVAGVVRTSTARSRPGRSRPAPRRTATRPRRRSATMSSSKPIVSR